MVKILTQEECVGLSLLTGKYVVGMKLTDVDNNKNIV